MRTECHIEIGLDAVTASWSHGAKTLRTWREPVGGAAGCNAGEVEADDGGASRFGPAIAAALTRVLPKRRCFSPRVRVTVADPLLRMAVMRFAALPKRPADQKLVISQRFCREHRIDPMTMVVAFARQATVADGGQPILVAGIARQLHAAIGGALAAYELHADDFAPHALRVVASSRGPTILSSFGDGYATLAVLDVSGNVTHIVPFRGNARDEPGFIEKLKARILRYASPAGINGPRLPLAVAALASADVEHYRAFLEGDSPAPSACASSSPGKSGRHARRGIAPRRLGLNFSQNLEPRSRALAIGLAGTACAAFAAAVFLVSDAATRHANAVAHEHRAVRLSTDIEAIGAATAQAPDLDAFQLLRRRMDRLEGLDFAESPAAGQLLDTLESVLPDAALLTSLNYDRSKGQAEIVAMAPSGEDLTTLFERLHRHDLFLDVRLVDKKHTTSSTNAQVQQVHFVLAVGSRHAASAHGSKADASAGAASQRRRVSDNSRREPR